MKANGPKAAHNGQRLPIDPTVPRFECGANIIDEGPMGQSD